MAGHALRGNAWVCLLYTSYPNLKELIENMFETMDNAEGVGLAAPQIGLPIRVVTITLAVLSDDLPEYKDFRKAYINAHICLLYTSFLR